MTCIARGPATSVAPFLHSFSRSLFLFLLFLSLSVELPHMQPVHIPPARPLRPASLFRFLDLSNHFILTLVTAAIT